MVSLRLSALGFPPTECESMVIVRLLLVSVQVFCNKYHVRKRARERREIHMGVHHQSMQTRELGRKKS
jgi:hypothetical protein